MSSVENSRVLWDEIVQMTSKCKYDECTGLRQPIFLDSKKKARLITVFESLLKIFFISIRPKKRMTFSKKENSILFYFPYNTSAMAGNLEPVLQQFKIQGHAAFIVGKKGLPNIEKDILKEELIYFNTYGQKITSLYRACAATNNLFTLNRNLPKERRTLASRNFMKYCYLLYTIFLTQFTWEKIIKYIGPKAVLSTSDYFPIDYSLFRTVKNSNVPNYIIQHGIVGVSYFPFTASKMFVYGKASLDDMLSKGCPKERLIIGGMPASDDAFNEQPRPESKTDKYKDNKKKIVVLSDSQGIAIYPNVYVKFRSVLIELVENNTSFDFLIKLHPAEDESFFGDEFNKYDNFNILAKDTSLGEAFEMADYAMTIWSTAGLDAIISGLPLIVMDVLPEIREYAYWPLSKGGVYLTEIESFKYNFTLELSEKFKNEILADQNGFLNYYFENQGLSAKHIESIITNDCQNSK